MTPEPSPSLAMLWEGGDPHLVLRTRFGCEDAAAAVSWVAAVLEEHWDVTVDACERIVLSDSNALAWVVTSRGRLVVKWSVAAERFSRLAALADLTTWLDSRGLPVSAPVATRDGLTQLEVDGVSLCVQREIEGDLLDVADLEAVSSTGATLAHLHDALATYADHRQAPVAATAPEPLTTRISGWLDTPPAQVPRVAVDLLRRLLADAPSGVVPVQLVHGDVRAANVLTERRRVVAVLDFEEARLDHRVVELARSAVLLGTRFHDWGPVSSEVRAQLRAGYESVRPLTADEARWWDVLVLWVSGAMVPAGEDPTGWGTALLDQTRTIGPEPT